METADLVTFTEEILNGKLPFCAVYIAEFEQVCICQVVLDWHFILSVAKAKVNT